MMFSTARSTSFSLTSQQFDGDDLFNTAKANKLLGFVGECAAVDLNYGYGDLSCIRVGLERLMTTAKFSPLSLVLCRLTATWRSRGCRRTARSTT